ncbi:MAG: hypothetical protein OXH81_15225 [Gemmatimonadetes bacterium]|nr:hypothetical protein [Gemmatimonadota bacterium]MDE2734443.1 hypothetical protein [Gemmatimonadota bacterium]
MKSSFVLLLVLGFALPGSAHGDSVSLGDLKAQYRALESQRDSLAGQRLRVAAEAEALSARIDSLRLSAANSAALPEALRSSLRLVQHMVEIEWKLVALEARQDSLAERLCLAYDWEIGVLIQKLAEQPDRGLSAQLTLYQEAREQLGVGIHSANLYYSEQMKIEVEDGPDEIQQKQELLEDIADRLKVEWSANADLLRRLEAEHRLCARAELARAKAQRSEERVLVSGEQPQEQVRLLRQDEPLAEFDLESSIAEVALKIHKLKARQQEILQLQAVVEERAKAFRRYLRSMLEGEE